MNGVTGFKCTTLWNIYTLHHTPIAPRKVSFHSHFPPLCPPPFGQPFYPLAISIMSVSMCYVYIYIYIYIYIYRSVYPYVFWFIPTHPSIQAPLPLPLTQLSLCSMCPCVCFYFFVTLFCLLDSTHKWDNMVFCFSDWLTSIVISRSIYAAAKSKIFFLMAE